MTSNSLWLEVTDRTDLGADLHAPQTREDGRPYWSYGLLCDVRPGDLIFHYHKPQSAVVACSRAEGIAVEKEVVWAARGPSARSRGIQPHRRAGWSLPLTAFQRLATPLSLDEIEFRKQELRSALADLADKAPNEAKYFPFELSEKRAARPLQGYLFRIPRGIAALLHPLQNAIAEAPSPPQVWASPPPPARVAQRVAPYGTHILGRPYREPNLDVSIAPCDPFERDPELLERSLRSHAETQNLVASWLRERGLEPLSPAANEPLFDVAWNHDGRTVVAEIKTITPETEIKQLRLGIGQLVFYRFFLGTGGRVVNTVLITDKKPSYPDAGPLCASVGIRLLWPAIIDQLANL